MGAGKLTTINQFAEVLLRLRRRSDLKPKCVAPRKVDIRSSCADIGKTKRALCYKPKVALKEGLRMMLKSEQCRENYESCHDK